MRALRFVARGACAIPHREKRDRGGEDGFFLSQDGRSIGVADGVGGWIESGINPAFFTWTLMKRCLHHASTTGGSAAQVLDLAFSDALQTKLRGSCTVAVATVNDDGTATVAHVGDCGVIVVRDGTTVVHRTKEQQWRFNAPYQIGPEHDKPSDGISTTLDVKPRDVFVLGSDGLFDNVYDHEIVDVVELALNDAPKGSTIDCDELAEELARKATEYGRDKTYISPFARAASDAVWGFTGGKEDDVCVVVGQVGEPGAKAKPVKFTLVDEYFRARGEPCAPMPGDKPASENPASENPASAQADSGTTSRGSGTTSRGRGKQSGRVTTSRGRGKQRGRG